MSPKSLLPPLKPAAVELVVPVPEAEVVLGVPAPVVAVCSKTVVYASFASITANPLMVNSPGGAVITLVPHLFTVGHVLTVIVVSEGQVYTKLVTVLTHVGHPGTSHALGSLHLVQGTGVQVEHGGTGVGVTFGSGHTESLFGSGVLESLFGSEFGHTVEHEGAGHPVVEVLHE